MGMVEAEIILKNSREVHNLTIGLCKDYDVHETTVKAVVDTGAMTLIINEEIRQKLNLQITREKKALIANGEWTRCMETEPVEIHWKNRNMSCNAFVIPATKKILLGAIPLEGMDLIVNPVTQELAGAHGDEVEIMCVGVYEAE